ncbi:hypothetical protein EZQ42_005398, partial [Escherichia coli]|nr:hypothetical protein [Escherichia coli]
MNIEKSRLISEAAPHLNASLSTINGNEFAAIVPVIPGHIGGRETNIVSAKALHKALGVGKDFSTWITGLKGERYRLICCMNNNQIS